MRGEILWDLARVFRAWKQIEEADRFDRERRKLFQDHAPVELVDAAFKELDRALVIGYGKTPVSERAAAVREIELEESAENVRLAIAMGFKDLAKLRSHPDSAFLLSRDDIKPLIMDLSVPDSPFLDE